MMQGNSKAECMRLGKEALDLVDMGDRAHHLPSELSGGQQQRVSIARALINKPKIIFADEPTANLDSRSSHSVLNLFTKLNKELGLTIAMVTHEPEDKNIVDRVINLKDCLITKVIQAPEVLNCEHCNCKVYEDGAITRTIKGKIRFFCSENCADSVEAD
jgi:putative ABC transport system ATP-binding protein